MSKWHGGKGDEQRPTNRQRFAENYEAIFNKKATEERVELDEGFHITKSDGRLYKAQKAIARAKGENE